MIPYLGEKSKYKNFIKPYLPKKIVQYVEPFGGMFGVYFILDMFCISVYNDINKDNYYLFKYLQIPGFMDMIRNIEPFEELYNEYKNTLNEGNQSLKSLKYLFLLCHCNVVGDFDSIYRDRGIWSTIPDNINQFQNINFILNKDYKEVINEFDSKYTFFYVDPPYFGFEQRYNNHNFTKESHRELLDVLKNIKGKFILSYYDFNLIKEYSWCNIVRKKFAHQDELLIMNY